MSESKLTKDLNKILAATESAEEKAWLNGVIQRDQAGAFANNMLEIGVTMTQGQAMFRNGSMRAALSNIKKNAQTGKYDQPPQFDSGVYGVPDLVLFGKKGRK